MEGFSVQLERDPENQKFRLAWVSESVTSSAPFLHREYVFETSPDLIEWTTLEEVTTGGAFPEASRQLDRTFPATGDRLFVRVSARLNLPGADLRDFDLSGADLRGANLAGTDLTGADLTGANLDGSNLSGARLDGTLLAGARLIDALMDEVNLDDLDLTQVDLGGIIGAARLSRLPGDPDADAALVMPALGFEGSPEDMAANDPDLPCLGVSIRHAMVMLKPGVTVAEVNQLVEKYNAVIVGCEPADQWFARGVLMLEFPTSSVLALYNETESLRNESTVAASAPDILMGYDAVPDDSSAGFWISPTPTRVNWKWDDDPVPPNGNWGLKFARVPQMWNLKSAIEKRTGGTGPQISTVVIDAGFENHVDLRIPTILNGPGDPNNSHGMLSAGIIGATHGGVGIDGVNPFSKLTGYSQNAVPWWRAITERDLSGIGGTASQFLSDTRSALASSPDAKIVNMSLGFNWKDFNAKGPLIRQRMIQVANQYGAQFAGIAGSHASSVLFTVSAGNDNGTNLAKWNSPMANAGLVQGAGNILVVEAHDANGNPTFESNIGGHLAAPGYALLSTDRNNGYGAHSGTSAAAPFVAGVAGYLLAIDPSLKPADLITLLIRTDDPNSNVDGFASLLDIDTIREGDLVMKMLLDIDDGTPDGSTRVEIPEPVLARDRSFEKIVVSAKTPDYEGDTQGDGAIDMGDFRRWRDWLLWGEQNGAESSIPTGLNGSETNLKHDANLDGRVDTGRETEVYPRGDFNGDGKMDRDSIKKMAGKFERKELTDLNVLIESKLFNDPYVTKASLPELIDSIDITVSAQNFFRKNPGVESGIVSIYDAASRTVVKIAGSRLLTPEKPEQIFTVPAAGKYYAASEPIPTGEDTKIMMRSIGELDSKFEDRGADYVVDLAAIEMTTKARIDPSGIEKTESRPEEPEVEAYLPAQVVGPDQPEGSVGSRAWANEQGTFYTLAHTGPTGSDSTDDPQLLTYSSHVVWRRSFNKATGVEDPTYKIKPMVLRLIDGLVDLKDLNARAEIRIEKRTFSRGSGTWQTVFHTLTEIGGYTEGLGGGHTFAVIDHQGDITQSDLKILTEEWCSGTPEDQTCLTVTYGSEYRQPDHTDKIPLSDVEDGDTFEIRYTLDASATALPFDEIGESYIGDPLDYGSGIQMAYGNFGELALPSNLILSAEGASVDFRSKPSFYYILEADGEGGAPRTPVAIVLGSDGSDTLIDPAPPANVSIDHYSIRNRPLTQATDLDGDGMDDVYELSHPAFLNALDPTDASKDQDEDGFTNLAEYQNGTDPETPDAPPAAESGIYPGILVQAGIETHLHALDLNHDDFIDLAGLSTSDGGALVAVLSNPDDTFQTPVKTSVTGWQDLTDLAVGGLDSDAFPDALIADSLADTILVFLGASDGRFQRSADITGIPAPSALVLADLNGDPLTDLIVISKQAKTVTLLTGTGLPGFNPLTAFTFDQSPQHAAIGDFNNDDRVDLAVSFTAPQVAVLLGQEGGGFDLPVYFDVGSDPTRIAAADLDGDGRDDLVAANRYDNDLSILLSASSGGFAAQQRYPVGEGPRGLRVADLTGDGRPEIVVSHLASPYHSVLKNLGSGTFSTARAGSAASNPEAVLGDFNRDTKPDLAAVLSEDLVGIFPGLDNAGFSTFEILAVPLGLLTDLEVADLDSDQSPEIVALNQRDNTLLIIDPDGVNGIQIIDTIAIPGRPEQLVIDTLDGDEIPDLAIASVQLTYGLNRGENRLDILLSNGDGTFATPLHYPLAAPPTHLLPANLNGEGPPDLVAVMAASGQVTAFVNSGNAVFAADTTFSVGDYIYAAAAANLDGDPGDELAVSVLSGGNNFLRIYKRGPTGDWSISQELAPSAYAQTLRAHDVNGDGRIDLLVSIPPSSGSSSRLELFPGTDGPLGPAESFTPDGAYVVPHFADLDADGREDLIFEGTTIRIHPGLASDGFGSATEYWGGTGGDLRFADLNGDEKPDIIVRDGLSGTIGILFHQ